MVCNVLYSNNDALCSCCFESKSYISICLSYSTDEISLNKVATQSHTHKGDSYSAHNAVDRNTSTCMRTRDIGTSSDDKTVWWKVDLDGVYSIYSVTILFKDYRDFCMLFFICCLTGLIVLS